MTQQYNELQEGTTKNFPKLNLTPRRDTGGGDGDNGKWDVETGCYAVELLDVTDPYIKEKWGGKLDPETGEKETQTVIKMTFGILGEPTIDGGYEQSSHLLGKMASVEVTYSDKGPHPKSNLYKIITALTGMDMLEYYMAFEAENGRPPEVIDYINLKCFVEIERKPSSRDPNKFYSNIDKDSFSATVPAKEMARMQREARRAANGGVAQSQPMQKPAVAAAQPTRPPMFAAAKKI